MSNTTMQAGLADKKSSCLHLISHRPLASKEEQQVTDACKRFIQNAIICWNYLYLTKLILKTNPQNRQAILEIIASSSPVNLKHINMQREFDISDD